MSRIWPVASTYASPRLRTTSANVCDVRATSKSRPSIVWSVNVSSSARYELTVPAIRSENVKRMEFIDSSSESAVAGSQDDDAAAGDDATLVVERPLLVRLADVFG